MINYLKRFIIPLASLLLIPLILGLLNLIGIKSNNIECLIIMSLIFFISGLFVGRKANSKGYLNGLIYSTIIIIIMFIISLLFKTNYEFNTIIYYFILILCGTFGSMTGIQKKEK